MDAVSSELLAFEAVSRREIAVLAANSKLVAVKVKQSQVHHHASDKEDHYFLFIQIFVCVSGKKM